MEQTIILLLCEGPHDAAIIYKVLRANGWQGVTNSPLNEFPYAISNYIQTEFSNISNLPLEELRPFKKGFLPSDLLKREVDGEIEYCTIWIMGGNTQFDTLRKVLKTFQAVNLSEFDEYENCTANFGMIFDADDDATAAIEEIKTNLNETLPEFCASLDSSNLNQTYSGKDSFPKTGLFIFTEPNSTQGKLESLLLPLFHAGNKQIFEATETFISTNHKFGEGEKGFDPQKAIIGTMGQFRKSGMTNQVIIKQSGFLTDTNLKVNSQAVDLYRFIESLTS